MQAKEATHPVLRCYGGMPCDITAPYLRHIFDISSTLQHHICDITATYLRHYIDITATYLRHYSTISSTLQRHYSNISSTLHRHYSNISATLQHHIFDSPQCPEEMLFKPAYSQHFVFRYSWTGYFWSFSPRCCWVPMACVAMACVPRSRMHPT